MNTVVHRRFLQCRSCDRVWTEDDRLGTVPTNEPLWEATGGSNYNWWQRKWAEFNRFSRRHSWVTGAFYLVFGLVILAVLLLVLAGQFLLGLTGQSD